MPSQARQVKKTSLKSFTLLSVKKIFKCLFII
jgi:hypothetical protein